MQLASNNRRRCLNLVRLLLLLIHSSSFSSFLSSVSLRFNSLSFSLKSMILSTPPNCLLSNPFALSPFSNTEHRIQKWFIHIKVYFVLSKKEELISSRSSRHVVPTEQNKLCTHDKNLKRANSGQSRSQRPRFFWLATGIATSGQSNSGSPRFTDFPSLCACSESSLTNLIGSGLDLLCLQSHSKPECGWTWPGVPIFPVHVKRDPWGRG